MHEWERRAKLYDWLRGVDGRPLKLKATVLAVRSENKLRVVWDDLRLLRDLGLVARESAGFTCVYTLCQPELGLVALLPKLAELGANTLVVTAVHELLVRGRGQWVTLDEMAGAVAQQLERDGQTVQDLIEALAQLDRAGLLEREGGDRCRLPVLRPVELTCDRDSHARPPGSSTATADRPGRPSNLTVLWREALIFLMLVRVSEETFHSVKQIASATGLHVTTVKKGLAALELVRLVKCKGEGRYRHYALSDPGLGMDAMLPHLRLLGANARILGVVNALSASGRDCWVSFEDLANAVEQASATPGTQAWERLTHVLNLMVRVALLEHDPDGDRYRLPNPEPGALA